MSFLESLKAPISENVSVQYTVIHTANRNTTEAEDGYADDHSRLLRTGDCLNLHSIPFDANQEFVPVGSVSISLIPEPPREQFMHAYTAVMMELSWNSNDDINGKYRVEIEFI